MPFWCDEPPFVSILADGEMSCECCDWVAEDEAKYDAEKSKYEALKSRYETLKSEHETLKSEHETLQSEHKKLYRQVQFYFRAPRSPEPDSPEPE